MNHELPPTIDSTRTRDIDVLVVGDANPDLILRGDVVPRFGQSEQLLESADLTLGGSGAIVAHGLARLGLRTTLVAAIGADTFGVLTREQLSSAGIDPTELRTDPDRPTGLSVILTQGETRSSLTLVGAIAALDPATISTDLLARARHVHASSFFLQPTLAAGLAELFRRAQEVGTTTSLDTTLDPAGRWDGLADVLAVTDVLLPNRTEVLGLAARYGAPAAAGEPVPSRSDLENADVVAAATALASRGPLVVVKDGERGAVAVLAPAAAPTQDASSTRRVFRQPGYRVVAVDGTGAGDSFDAAFLAARLHGLAIPASLAVACRAGALCTLGIGGTSAQATAAQLGLENAGPRIGLRLRPMAPAEISGYIARLEVEYAADLHESTGIGLEAAREESRQSTVDSFPEGQVAPNERIWVAEDARGDRVGVLWLAHRDPGTGKEHAWIYDIEVDEAHRGKGYGRQLLVLAEEQTRALGLTSLRLNVFGRNHIARALYRTQGFAESRVTMVKDVSHSRPATGAPETASPA